MINCSVTSDCTSQRSHCFNYNKRGNVRLT